jgi:inner membrane protein
MAAVFAVLYGLLYLILSLEHYALLGFAALTTVMFATLRIDWSGTATRAASSMPR